MTHDEMIAIIQAHKEGKTIYRKAKFKSVDKWEVSIAPGFNFNAFDYKVKGEPQVIFACPKHIQYAYGEKQFTKLCKNMGNDGGYLGGIHISEYKKFIEVMED
jgi:hypothetical protein